MATIVDGEPYVCYSTTGDDYGDYYDLTVILKIMMFLHNMICIMMMIILMMMMIILMMLMTIFIMMILRRLRTDLDQAPSLRQALTDSPTIW